MTEAIKNRYDFILFFDVENGNPNGDPDAGNMPRIDPETGIGIVSDVCLKRKVRNYVDLVKAESISDPDASGDRQGYKIYVQEKAILEERQELAYTHNDLRYHGKELPKDTEEQKKVQQFMCDNFYDVRTFGAMMNTTANCGIVRGPVQMCFAQSIDPVIPQEMRITRMAVANKEEAKKKERTFGGKQYVPYGLYRAEGFISASLAEKTGFSDADLQLFWEALMNMFEDDRSAARGLMTSRKLIVFKHESKLGNAPARTLFDTVKASRISEDVPRHYSDYQISIAESTMPQGVEVSSYDWIKPER